MILTHLVMFHFIEGGEIGQTPDALQGLGRHYNDRIMLSLFVQETSYDTAPASWSTAACAMLDFDDDSPHETWDDVVEDDDQLIHTYEYTTVQELVRQSVRLPYAEPRVKPNSLAGLLGLSLGIVTSTQDGTATAYRHAVTQSLPTELPSIGAQVQHQFGAQFVYTGLKAEGFTLSNNGPYLRFECPLIGSGTRSFSTDNWPEAIDERWLRWGDCHVYLVDVTGTPVTITNPPDQGTTNLDGGVDFSTRILRMEISHPNSLWAEGGYRPSTLTVRGALVTPKRHTEVTMELQVNTPTEATELQWYLTQRQLAFEWQCVGTSLIDPAGTFFYGATLIIPRMQFRAIRRAEQNQHDTIELVGRVMDDFVNPVELAWVYNAQPAYLA